MLSHITAGVFTVRCEMGLQAAPAGFWRGPVGFHKGSNSEGCVALQVPHIQLARILNAVTHHIPAARLAHHLQR